MSKLFIAILLVMGSPMSKITKTVNGHVIQTLMPDPTTGGEGGHIPPTPYLN